MKTASNLFYALAVIVLLSTLPAIFVTAFAGFVDVAGDLFAFFITHAFEYLGTLAICVMLGNAFSLFAGE